MIHLKKLNVEKKGKKILSDIVLNIEKGRIATFIGKSGSGKTTLLKCFAGLCAYTGHINVNADIGFVLQNYALFPHMTVEQNCLHPLQSILKLSKNEAQEKTTLLLQSLQIEEQRHSYPSKLSGGQQQRVAIARALCMEPKILLFDEPTAALDPENTANFVSILKTLQQSGVTIIISTHDLGLFNSIVDKVFLLEDGSLVETYDVQTDCLSKKPKIRSYTTSKT